MAFEAGIVIAFMISATLPTGLGSAAAANAEIAAATPPAKKTAAALRTVRPVPEAMPAGSLPARNGSKILADGAPFC